MNAPPYHPPEPQQAPKKSNPAIWWVVGIIGCGGMFLCIALMAAVLFPVFQQAKVTARGTACSSNLQILSQATMMYTSDWDGALPLGQSWMDGTEVYAAGPERFDCPEGPGRYGYAFSATLSGRILDELPDPGSTPMIFDSVMAAKNAAAGTDTMPSPPRHRNRQVNNVAFANGAVVPVGSGGQPLVDYEDEDPEP